MPEERAPAAPSADGRRSSLRADCARCFGLCCVAPAFSASADFAIDKDAGQACPNLRPDFRCAIHDRLRQKGFPGCTVYDCFGAGQKVAQGTFGGRDWRRTPHLAAQMFQVFTIMRQLHELLWYLTEALTLQPARPLHGALGLALDETERLTQQDAGALAELDVVAHQRAVNTLLLRASELARAGARRNGGDLRGADLAGKDLKGADLSATNLIEVSLRRANLEGADLNNSGLIDAVLRDANLKGANLSEADLFGADLSNADLAGADLSESRLTRAILTGANLEGAKLKGALMPDGSVHE